MNGKSNVTGKTYKLYCTFTTVCLPLIVLSVVSIAAFLLLLISTWNGRFFILAALLAAGAFALWFHASSVTWRIVADETTGDIEFVGLLTKRRVHVTQIVSIVPDQAYGRNLVVSLQSGSPIPLYNSQFDGFHDFLTWLEKANPKIQLRGC